MNTLIDVFKPILNMSFMGSVVILIVLLLRFILKMAPRKITYYLWLIVAIRLVIPTTLPSSISLFNLFDALSPNNISASYKTDMIQFDDNNEKNTYINTSLNIDTVENSLIPNAAPPPTVSTFTISLLGYLFHLPIYSVFIWLTGIGAFLIYYTLSYIHINKKLRYATILLNTTTNNKAYFCENISSPFVLGIINPKIYLPYGLSGDNLDLILEHEQYHIKQKDNLSKLFAFLLLAIYWFNPLIWIAYYYFGKDMELRCDEEILKNADFKTRRLYSTILLAFAGNNRNDLFSSVSFSKSNIQERIRIIMKKKKKTLLLSLISILLISIAAIILLTDVNTENKNTSAVDNTKEIFDISKYYNKIYCAYSMNDLGTYAPINIFVIDSNTISFGNPETGQMSNPIVYSYTLSNDIIYYNDDKYTFEIDFVNQTYFWYPTNKTDNVYIGEPMYIEEYTGYEYIYYADFLTQTDIDVAIKEAKKYYKDKNIEVNDMTLSYEYEELYSNIMRLNSTPDPYGPFPARNTIFLNVKTGNNTTRYITLTRKNINASWKVYKEGL